MHLSNIENRVSILSEAAYNLLIYALVSQEIQPLTSVIG